ncbi:M23 family metallopeptidase [Paenibacillus lutrae]|uniref:Peptidoglycan DD-metalloendopeptidase family protein n=1 Tax=Paenibacillus lutrae TaxID=2078573 RepID=A0A7X3FJ56_9BACL|nr:M23 family metallopeptidase [Paenibacillus lutrae]MVP00736.1 peptidoglycan DD-metalloendopeptidase family protein [Paenibacillus lutrae]
MRGSKGIDWARKLWKQSKAQWQSLTSKQAEPTSVLKDSAAPGRGKWFFLYSISSIALIGTLTITGQDYVEANLADIYPVKVGQETLGYVSSPEVLKEYTADREQKLAKQYPDVHMILPELEQSEPERAFRQKPDDSKVLALLDEKLKPVASGVELVIEGKTFAIVKDQATADKVLAEIKKPYEQKAKDSSQVAVLSADTAKPASTTVEKVEFVQKVETSDALGIQPQDVVKPDELIAKIKTGGVEPTKYTVLPGDCVSCIAEKLSVPKQVIYDKNPWIVDDQIREGDVLDLTVIKPALSVKTVEKMVENQDVQYETEVITDDTVKEGIVETISPGKNGLKQVTYELTKVNGQLVDEKIIGEEMVEKPVPAKVKKGTKVILGEGTGSFAWPVVSHSITSTFGTRWNKLHKGLDIVGNRAIVAADNGKVVSAGYKSDYGYYVLINHMNGYETMYAHMSKIETTAGTIVEKGEQIGVMGSTGDSTGVHLHFEIHKNGGLENPLKYLNH